MPLFDSRHASPICRCRFSPPAFLSFFLLQRDARYFALDLLLFRHATRLARFVFFSPARFTASALIDAAAACRYLFFRLRCCRELPTALRQVTPLREQMAALSVVVADAGASAARAVCCARC